MDSIVDSAVAYLADRWQYAQSAFKYRTPRKAPPYIAAELEKMSTFLDIEDLMRKYDEEKLQRMAIAVEWIYSNIRRIANEVSAPDFNVIERGSQEKDIDHELERIIASPNSFFGKAALMQYTAWVMMLSRQGAYWYLMPDFSNEGVIREIWPVPMDKLTPVKHATQFISHYEYDRGGGKKPLKIDKRFICRFFFPDPRDFWKSLTPLEASRHAIDIYSGITGSQVSLFGRAGGVPLAVVSVDKDIQEGDFSVVRQQLKEDWEEQKRIAVVRGGTISIGHVGITNRDLQVIASQENNRDSIDSTFMGFPWRQGGMGAEAMKEADRRIKESVIYPILLLMRDQIQIEIINPFYGEEYLAKFDDIRRTDEALLVQQRQVYWKAASVNEARRELNKPEYTDDVIPGLGNLPVNLANNAQFMIAFLGMQSGPVNNENQLPGAGNMEGSADPERVTALEAGEEMKGVDVSAAVDEAIKAELKRYRTVTGRAIERHGTPAEQVEFSTDIIPDETMDAIHADLVNAHDRDGVYEVFGQYLNVS